MKYEIIGSSSKGNAIILEDILLLDVGVSYVKIKKYISRIKLIFISHSHKDHLNPKTINQIAYNYPNIKYVTGSDIVVKTLVDLGVIKKNIYLLDSGKWYNLGMLNVKLEPLIHDTPNYAFKCQYNGKKMIYIVDTANVDNIKAKGYDLYLIENNYREDILQKHILECEEQSKLYYLDRVPRTHLSSEQCNSFLIENMQENGNFEYIHKSNYNYEELD